jgi:glycerol-3-phosphate dehydrogenase
VNRQEMFDRLVEPLGHHCHRWRCHRRRHCRRCRVARLRRAALEQHDFGKGTSSRSTKLVHGGVRYLEQGNISLVMEALKERGILRQNAPHLVSNLAFVVPNYDWWEAPFYGLGLKVYNVLAGKYGFGASEVLSREETLERLPTIRTEGLRGGVVYYDGQFDDARLLINLVTDRGRTGGHRAQLHAVTALTKGGDGFVDGIVVRDMRRERRARRGHAWSSTRPAPSPTASGAWPTPAPPR